MLTSEMRNCIELHFIILEEKEENFMQCRNGSQPYAVLKVSVVRKWLVCFNLKTAFKMDSEKTKVPVQFYILVVTISPAFVIWASC